jgi:hypothetical protein
MWLILTKKIGGWHELYHKGIYSSRFGVSPTATSNANCGTVTATASGSVTTYPTATTSRICSFGFASRKTEGKRNRNYNARRSCRCRYNQEANVRIMPKVPGNMDPSTLEAATGGQWQPDPVHLMMAASDMNERGRLIVPEHQSSHRQVGTSGRMLNVRRGSLGQAKK